MQAATGFRSIYLRYFSSPSHFRRLFRYLHGHAVHRIVQIGIGTADITCSMLEMVLRHSPEKRPRYTGVDLFEARPATQPGVSLKEAHRRVRHERLDVRLLPGDPIQSLTRSANDLRGTDLVLVSGDMAGSGSLPWHLIARILHKDSQVWIEERNPSGSFGFRVLGPAEVRSLGMTRAVKAA